MDKEENKIPRADMKWYHNVGFVTIIGLGFLVFIGGGMLIGSLL